MLPDKAQAQDEPVKADDSDLTPMEIGDVYGMTIIVSEDLNESTHAYSVSTEPDWDPNPPCQPGSYDYPERHERLRWATKPKKPARKIRAKIAQASRKRNRRC